MIPVFVSCPTTLSADQELKRKVIIDLLDDLQMEPRALGRGDYPKDFPLKEFMLLQNIVQEVSFLALSNSMLKRLSVSVEQKQRNG